MFATLNALPAADHPELVPEVVYAALRYLPSAKVITIDPDHADTETLVKVYDLPLEAMANAVLVQGLRAGELRQACCMTLAHRRVDVNNVVRRKLDVRKCSFAPMDVAVAASGMEYGGITPVGLPAEWPVWVDAAVADTDVLMIGAGNRTAKLIVSGAELLNLPGAERVEGLARDIA